ncbi:sigma-70 family RNA polymerase sigma factor [Tautonia plasticadhaerens]|uniref:ECF RNA polymerase sigma factor SigE n=1 Tax=Tautonia plasticadhaerens TaxID=2527974 RepID=A0A518GWZ7_9BACT|nr:sigma-70 family RNA polymerase sigma factor [Tautonia plasticadhaerens]QDV33116.1 ECF RNA polymerase sigma factor SigE [Tautonia plasticadhaerens]
MPADAPASGPARQLDLLFRRGTVNGLSEAQLLGRFLESRDDLAFEALVSRHGPMVLRTCRSLLADPNDAEDAFQATFLVLARRASTIRNPEHLGPWLHRTARRVCTRLGKSASRRRHVERLATESLDTAPAPDRRPHPDRLAIHAAIDRLPRNYRLVILLCDLEGRSHAEAASQLDWPLGTVKGRQSRARSLLRRRLSRLGLAPAGMSTLLLPSPLDAALLPPALVSRTARSAAAFAAGGVLAAGTVPAGVLGLTNGVLSLMLLKTWILGPLTALAPIILLAGAVTAYTGQPRASDREAPEADAPRGTLETPLPSPPGAEQTQPRDLDALSSLAGSWLLVAVNGSREVGPARLKIQVMDLLEGDSKGFLLCTDTTDFREMAEPVRRRNDLDEMHINRFNALVDPTDDPSTWDYLYSSPDARLNPVPAIYRIEEDELTILSSTDGTRPAGFDQDGNAMRIVYERIPDEPPDDGVVGIVPDSGREPETPSPTPSAASNLDAIDASPLPPEDSIAPLIGGWRLVSAEGDPDMAKFDPIIGIRAADPRLAGLVDTDGTPVVVSTLLHEADGTDRLIEKIALVDPTLDPARWDPSLEPAHWDSLPIRALASGDGALRDIERGIYRLEGDRLMLHLGLDRPSDFERRDHTRLYVYERIDGGVAGDDPDPGRDPETPSTPHLGANTTPASPPPEAAASPAPDHPVASVLGTWRRTSANHIPTPEGASATLELSLADPGLLSEVEPLGVPILCKSVVTPGPDGSVVRGRTLAMFLGDGNSGHFDYLSLDELLADRRKVVAAQGIYLVNGDTLQMFSSRFGRPSRFDELLIPGMNLEVYERSPGPLPAPTAAAPEPTDSYGFAPPPNGVVTGVAPDTGRSAGTPSGADPGSGSTPASPPSPDQILAEREELERERIVLVRDLSQQRPKAEASAIEAEVLGELYRERLTEYQALRRSARDDQASSRDDLDRLAFEVDQLRESYLKAGAQMEEERGDVRALEAELDRIERRAGRLADPTPPIAEGSDPLLDEFEARLDRLTRLVESLADEEP